MTSDQGPLHIGLCSPALPDSGATNGIVTYTRIMRDALRGLGHKVTVVTTCGIEQADGRVISLPEPNPLLRRLQLVSERRHDGDGSHAGVRVRIIAAFAAARRDGVQIFEMEESFGWARRLVGRGAAIVERLHGPHAFVREWTETRGQRAEGDLKEAAEFDSMRRVQAVTAPTQALLDALAGQYRVTLPLTRAIPNPIPVASGAVQWRIDDADPNQLLYVGRFDSLKGADIVLQAFEQALQRRPSLTLVIAGPDLGLIDGGGALVHFDEFAAREMSAQARARVRFLGAQAPARVADLRLQSGVSILTSRFENFPYSIAEAMAAGMPVLASNTFGAREMIRDGIEGRIVPAEDVEATAEVMVAMASNPLQLAAMGKAGRERVTEWLSPERIARETVEVYREALRRL